MYDEAYRKNPHDASLVSRIGQAYVKTHQYAKVRPPGGGLATQGKSWGSRWEETVFPHQLPAALPAPAQGLRPAAGGHGASILGICP